MALLLLPSSDKELWAKLAEKLGELSKQVKVGGEGVGPAVATAILGFIKDVHASPYLANFVKNGCSETNGEELKAEYKLPEEGLKVLEHVLANPDTHAPLSNLINAALEMPSLWPEGTHPQLTSGGDSGAGGQLGSVEMDQGRVRCLLAHMFLCSIPPGVKKVGWDTHSFACWHALLRDDKQVDLDTVAGTQYLRCMLDFFAMPSVEGVVRVELWGSPPSVNNDESAKCCGVEAFKGGVIGDSQEVEVVFANCRIGFGKDATQEETVVGMSPEACVAPLLARRCLPMPAHQSILVTGGRRFGAWSGYGATFRYTGQDKRYHECPRRDLLFIDALDLNETCFGKDANTDVKSGVTQEAYLLQHQLTDEIWERELAKAECGFRAAASTGTPVVGTGHWGCGVFGGDKGVKGTAQILAATRAGVGLHYYCFGDAAIADGLEQLATSHTTAGALTKLRQDYKECVDQHIKDVKSGSKDPCNPPSLFEFARGQV